MNTNCKDFILSTNLMDVLSAAVHDLFSIKLHVTWRKKRKIDKLIDCRKKGLKEYYNLPFSISF